MSITSKLSDLHTKGVGLAQEAVRRAVSPPTRSRQAMSLGRRVEAAAKAGLPQEAIAKPKRRPQKQRK